MYQIFEKDKKKQGWRGRFVSQDVKCASVGTRTNELQMSCTRMQLHSSHTSTPKL